MLRSGKGQVWKSGDLQEKPNSPNASFSREYGSGAKETPVKGNGERKCGVAEGAEHHLGTKNQ